MCYDMNAYVELLAGSERSQEEGMQRNKNPWEGSIVPDFNQHQKVLLLFG